MVPCLQNPNEEVTIILPHFHFREMRLKEASDLFVVIKLGSAKPLTKLELIDSKTN